MIKFIMLLVLLIACGKAKKDSNKKTREDINEDGVYFGNIGAFHKSANPGSIKITKIGDSVEVTVKFNGATSDQYLYDGTYCPASAGDVESTSGKRLMGFDIGTHESSYSLMLADLRKRAMTFEDKTFIVFKDGVAIGCADIDRYWGDDPTEFPDPEPPRRRPTHRPSNPPPEYHPPPPPPEEHTSWWERLTDRLRRWWCRFRGRCS